MPINMPGYRHLNAWAEGLNSVANSALDYISRRRQEEQTQRSYDALRGYFGSQGNTQPVQPQQPGPGEPLKPIQNVPTVTGPTSPQNQMLDMFQQMKLDPAQAFQAMQSMRPKYVQLPGVQGELDQAMQDPSSGAVLPDTMQRLREPIAKQTSHFSWTEADEAGKPMTRKVGDVTQIKYLETGPDGRPTGNVKWENVPRERITVGGSPMYAPLNSAQERIAQKIARYEYDPKLLPGMRGTDRNAIMSRALEINPDFNSMEYPIRAKAAADFRSPNGVAGRNVTALNTAIGHMADLHEAMKGLQNADVNLWNKIKNVGLTQTGDPRVVRFMTAANAVEGEIAKVFAGKAGTDQEINEWRQALNSSQSPEQMQSAIQTLAHLLQSRIATLNWQAQQNVGAPIQMLSPKSTQTLQGLGINPDAVEANHSLTPGDIQDGFRFKGGDPSKQTSWEQAQ